MKKLVVLCAVAVLAGCGGSSKPAPTKTSAPPTLVQAMRTLVANGHPDVKGGAVNSVYEGTSWGVAIAGKGNDAYAAAFHLLAGVWRPDTTGIVKVEILGPKPGEKARATPQVAIQITAPTKFVESALWVDGVEILEKGGGSDTRGTIYGAPLVPLKPGLHIAVGYARTANSGTARAWIFHV